MTRIRRSTVACVSLACVAWLFACGEAYPPLDVAGWENTRWGMTEDQIRALYPQAPKTPAKAPRSTNLYVPLVVEDWDLYGYGAEIHFQMDETTKTLEQVVININCEDLVAAFDHTSQHLQQRFGPPDMWLSCGQVSWRSNYWPFPSTVVQLGDSPLKMNDSEGCLKLFYRSPRPNDPPPPPPFARWLYRDSWRQMSL